MILDMPKRWRKIISLLNELSLTFHLEQSNLMESHPKPHPQVLAWLVKRSWVRKWKKEKKKKSTNFQNITSISSVTALILEAVVFGKSMTILEGETVLSLLRDLLSHVCVYIVYAQSCPTLCSLPGSAVHRTFQTRILKWVAISSSRGSSQPRDQTHVSCVSLLHCRQILYALSHWGSHILYIKTHIYMSISNKINLIACIFWVLTAFPDLNAVWLHN